VVRRDVVGWRDMLVVHGGSHRRAQQEEVTDLQLRVYALG
jgi:hypothetical protein